MNQITKRDQRAILIAVIFIGLLSTHHFAIKPWLTHWDQVKAKTSAAQAKLKKIDTTSSTKAAAEQKHLLGKVPTFIMPTQEDKQRLLFEKQFTQQLKQVGIKPKSLKYLPAQKSKTVSGAKLLKLQCRSTANFSQILDLLATLPQNPYFVSIEEIDLKAQDEGRQKFDLNLTVSTFTL